MAGIEFVEGPGNKKYTALITKSDGKTKRVSFGDRRYQHFRDRIGLWSHLDHNNKQRRKNYRARHGAQGHQNVKHSPAWFSWRYLW